MRITLKILSEGIAITTIWTAITLPVMAQNDSLISDLVSKALSQAAEAKAEATRAKDEAAEAKAEAIRVSNLMESITSKLLPNAVVAFNSPSCPQGWKDFERANGRTIIGSGKGTGLTHREFNSQLGEETHKLTIEEIPRHSHSYTWYAARDFNSIDDGHDDADGFNREKETYHGETEKVGGDNPHNNMQPSLVLKYCIKE